MSDETTRAAITRIGVWISDLRCEPDGGSGGTAAALLERISTVARATEAEGFDSLWVTDSPVQLADGPGKDQPTLEVNSLLGALAVRTHSLRLGALPTGIEDRMPSIVAKIVTGIDVISHGRSTLSVWLPPGADEDMCAQLVERLEVSRAVLNEELPVFSGTFYAVDGAVNRPRPVQAGGIPLVVFGELTDVRRPLVLEAIGRFADAVVVATDLSDTKALVELLREAAVASNRSRGAVQVISMLDGGDRGLGGDPATPGQVVHVGMARLAAGASGCIVPIRMADAIDVLGQLGPLFRQAFEGVSTWTGDPATD